MKLGNSNGNNRGKKYFMRGRDDQNEPTPENRAKADHFNEWFSEHIDVLINFLKMKSCYDADAFNTTYMRICEKILYSGPVIKDYKAYFHRSYYTNYIQDKTKENRYKPLPAYDHLEAHHTNPYEREQMQNNLENDIFDYVFKKYDLREFEIFKMYITLKPAINYHALSEITHIQVHNIQRIVSKILVDIRNNKQLVDRYKDVK